MRQVLRQRLLGALAFSTVSAIVSALVTPFFFGFQAVPLMHGFAIGFFASFFIMALNATALDRAAAKLAVWQLFTLGFAAYAAIIAGVAFVSFRVTGADALFGAGQLYTFSLAFGIAFSLVANAVIAVAGIVGSAELVQLLVGRYHRPALERRAFLFMNLRGSTAAAEALGDERFLSFLNEAYADLGEAAVATRAKISTLQAAIPSPTSGRSNSAARAAPCGSTASSPGAQEGPRSPPRRGTRNRSKRPRGGDQPHQQREHRIAGAKAEGGRAEAA